MPKPKDRETMLKASKETFTALQDLISGMSDEIRTAMFSFDPLKQGKEAHWKRDQNVRDVLIHLYEWHVMMIRWVESNTKGESRPFLIEPYNWKTYGQLNVELWKKHQDTSLNQAIMLLDESHEKVMTQAESLSNEVLFTKGYFPWVGGSTLGQYIISVTSSHYEWAIRKLTLHLKTRDTSLEDSQSDHATIPIKESRKCD